MIKAKNNYANLMADSAMQDAQDPYPVDPSQICYKNRTETKKASNKSQNKRSHQDYIIDYNIIDPDSMPSNTLSEEDINI